MYESTSVWPEGVIAFRGAIYSLYCVTMTTVFLSLIGQNIQAMLWSFVTLSSYSFGKYFGEVECKL